MSGADARVRCTVSVVPFNLTPAFDRTGITAEAHARISANNARAILVAPAEEFLGDLRANLDAYDLRRTGARLRGRPVMLVGGKQDRTVPMAQVTELAERLRADGVRVELDGFDDDHLFTRDQPAMARRVVEWMRGSCG